MVTEHQTSCRSTQPGLCSGTTPTHDDVRGAARPPAALLAGAAGYRMVRAMRNTEMTPPMPFGTQMNGSPTACKFHVSSAGGCSVSHSRHGALAGEAPQRPLCHSRCGASVLGGCLRIALEWRQALPSGLRQPHKCPRIQNDHTCGKSTRHDTYDAIRHPQRGVHQVGDARRPVDGGTVT